MAELSACPQVLLESKRAGFAGRQIAAQLRSSDLGCSATESDIRHMRQKKGIVPVIKQIDTLAAEFPAEINYLYLTYIDIN